MKIEILEATESSLKELAGTSVSCATDESCGDDCTCGSDGVPDPEGCPDVGR